MGVYLVGGAVRDRFLGLPIKEKDWCVVGSSPEEMKKRGYQSVGKDFPVFLHPETKEEYALARTEKKIKPKEEQVIVKKRGINTNQKDSKTLDGEIVEDKKEDEL